MVNRAKKLYTCNLLSEHRNRPRKIWNIKQTFPSSKAKTFHSAINFHDTSKAYYFNNKNLLLVNFIWRQPPHISTKTEQIEFKNPVKYLFKNNLKWFKEHKVTAIDYLPLNLIKYCSWEIARPLFIIIFLTLKPGIIPTEWKTAMVTSLQYI